MDGAMREKILSKLMEFLAMMPEKEEGAAPEGDPKLEMLSIDAKPEDEKDLLGKC